MGASAILIGVSAGLLVWALLHRHWKHRALSDRIASAGELNLPYPFVLGQGAKFEVKNRRSNQVRHEDKLARSLFLAGYRSSRHMQLLRFLLHLSLILPILIALFYLIKGDVILTSLTLPVIVGAGGLAAIYAAVYFLRKYRQRKILRALPNFFDLLIVCLESGLSFTASLPRVVQEFDPHEPLAREFKTMHHEFLGGIALAQACDRLARRCEVPDLSVVLNAVVHSDQMGASLADTLRIQARELRDKHRQRMREKALKIPVKIVFPTILIFITIFSVSLGPALYKLSRDIAAF